MYRRNVLSAISVLSLVSCGEARNTCSNFDGLRKSSSISKCVSLEVKGVARVHRSGGGADLVIPSHSGSEKYRLGISNWEEFDACGSFGLDQAFAYLGTLQEVDGHYSIRLDVLMIVAEDGRKSSCRREISD